MCGFDTSAFNRYLSMLTYTHMFTVISLIFCTLSAIEGSRPLTPGEADALYAIWGVRDMQVLIEIEENPQKFWQDTEYKLFKGETKLISHLDFCKWFTPIIKKKLAKKITEIEPQPWFAGDAIEEVLKDYIAEDSPAFQYALASCYARAYDYTRVYERNEVCRKDIDFHTEISIDFFYARERFRSTIETSVRDNFDVCIPPHPEKLLWQISPDGLFSFFDSLVTQSKGFYLCSIAQNPEAWESFSAHDGDFSLCSGILRHDAYTHAGNAVRLASLLQRHEISAQAQFDACCNSDALVGRNLITMSHQVQAWFTQFHEAPSQRSSFQPYEKISLLFPGRIRLTDPGLRDITPYFSCLPLNHNWRTTPLPKANMDDSAIQGTLFAWRSLYCAPSLRFLQTEDVSKYIKVLQCDYHYLTESDLMRASHFVGGMLVDLCALTGKTEVTIFTEPFETFLQKNKASKPKILKFLSRSAKCRLKRL